MTRGIYIWLICGLFSIGISHSQLNRPDSYQRSQQKLKNIEQQEEIDALKKKLEKEQEAKDQLNLILIAIAGLAIFGLGSVIYLLVKSRRREKEIADLESTVKKARRALAEREKFLAYTNHEIRTPLNAVAGSAKLLQSSPLNEKQEKYVHTIRASVENVLILVNDVLDLSRLESGKIEFQSTDFLPWEVMQGVKYILQEKVESKGIVFDLDMDPSIPAVLKGDPGHLNQILLNLCNNAVKFTDLGSVTLRARKINDDSESVRIRFEVVDTGKGIRKSKLPTIFNQYEQETRHTIKHKGGSGLGLSITKQLVELQGGVIEVDSKYMEGTTFSVELDFKKSKKKKLDKRTKQTADSSVLSNLKVMVVDDNEMNREIVQDLLKDCNPKVETILIESGKKAIDYLQDDEVDIILMDIQMPEMNGFETTTFIRKNMRSPLNNVPIIAMTAYTLEDAAQKCFEAGMNDYIAKPVDPNFLITKIDRLMKKKGMNKGQEISFMYVDLARLKELTAGDNTKMFKYIDIFLNNVPGDLKAMREAISEGDWKEVESLAHKIKGNAAYMGVVDLDTIYERIEKKDLGAMDRKDRKNLLNSFLELGELSVSEIKKIKSDYKLLFLDLK